MDEYSVEITSLFIANFGLANDCADRLVHVSKLVWMEFFYKLGEKSVFVLSAPSLLVEFERFRFFAARNQYITHEFDG